MVSTTASNLHAARVRPPSLARVLLVSFGVHVLVLVALSIHIASTIRTAPPAAIQVKLVGIPQPQAGARPKLPPEDIRTQASAAPKEAPPEAKNIPPSDATTKFVNENKPDPDAKPNPIEAKERPPVLDKTPEKKKVVKNKPDAKVVKNPEDFLANLDLDNLETVQSPATSAPDAKATDKPAGDGPELQLNLADEGVVGAIRQHVQQNWVFTPGIDTTGLVVVVDVEVDAGGNVLAVRVRAQSGNQAFDNSLLRAVRKASPLPIPAADFEKFQRLELAFEG